MATEFERSRWRVSGRDVTITSWRSETTHTWAASAPTYCHLLAADGPEESRAPSRAVAIERVVRELRALLGEPAPE